MRFLHRFLVLISCISTLQAQDKPKTQQDCTNKDKDYLYVVIADKAIIKETDGKFELTMENLENKGLRFTDRPCRSGSFVDYSEFFNNWSKYFPTKPSSGFIAFVDDGKDHSHDKLKHQKPIELAVNLAKPIYDDATHQLSISIESVTQDKKLIAGKFQRVALFIDLGVADKNCSEKLKEYLYVISAMKGMIKKKDGKFELIMTGLKDKGLRFSDRPCQSGSFIDYSDLFTNWAQYFPTAPNAGLIAFIDDGKDHSKDKLDDQKTVELAVRLTNPKYDEKADQLSLSIESVTEGEKLIRGNFQEMVLFVDYSGNVAFGSF